MKFFQDKKAYEPPIDYKVIFEAFCLGNFITVLEFISSVCEFIRVEESEVSPINHTLTEIKKLIRDTLKAIAHLKRAAHGKCELCNCRIASNNFHVSDFAGMSSDEEDLPKITFGSFSQSQTCKKEPGGTATTTTGGEQSQPLCPVCCVGRRRSLTTTLQHDGVKDESLKCLPEVQSS